MKFKTTEVGGTVEILAADDFDAIPFTVTETDAVKAGTPMTIQGKKTASATANGILLYDVDPSEYPNAALVVRGIIDQRKAEKHSGVTYDAATNSVHINSTQHYSEESPAVPSGPTEESVQAVLAQLKQTYPTGTVYPTPYRSTSGGPYRRGTHCSGWATLCSDAAFGNLPWRRVDNPSWNQIRPGDLIRYDNSGNGHVVVVISKTDEYVKVTESGLNNHARWGGQYFKWWLEEQPGYTLYTRYPE